MDTSDDQNAPQHQHHATTGVASATAAPLNLSAVPVRTTPALAGRLSASCRDLSGASSSTNRVCIRGHLLANNNNAAARPQPPQQQPEQQRAPPDDDAPVAARGSAKRSQSIADESPCKFPKTAARRKPDAPHQNADDAAAIIADTTTTDEAAANGTGNASQIDEPNRRSTGATPKLRAAGSQQIVYTVTRMPLANAPGDPTTTTSDEANDAADRSSPQPGPSSAGPEPSPADSDSGPVFAINLSNPDTAARLRADQQPVVATTRCIDLTGPVPVVRPVSLRWERNVQLPNRKRMQHYDKDNARELELTRDRTRTTTNVGNLPWTVGQPERDPETGAPVLECDYCGIGSVGHEEMAAIPAQPFADTVTPAKAPRISTNFDYVDLVLLTEHFVPYVPPTVMAGASVSGYGRLSIELQAAAMVAGLCPLPYRPRPVVAEPPTTRPAAPTQSAVAGTSVSNGTYPSFTSNWPNQRAQMPSVAGTSVSASAAEPAISRQSATFNNTQSAVAGPSSVALAATNSPIAPQPIRPAQKTPPIMHPWPYNLRQFARQCVHRPAVPRLNGRPFVQMPLPTTRAAEVADPLHAPTSPIGIERAAVLADIIRIRIIVGNRRTGNVPPAHQRAHQRQHNNRFPSTAPAPGVPFTKQQVRASYRAWTASLLHRIPPWVGTYVPGQAPSGPSTLNERHYGHVDDDSNFHTTNRSMRPIPTPGRSRRDQFNASQRTAAERAPRNRRPVVAAAVVEMRVQPSRRCKRRDEDVVNNGAAMDGSEETEAEEEDDEEEEYVSEDEVEAASPDNSRDSDYIADEDEDVDEDDADTRTRDRRPRTRRNVRASECGFFMFL